jgi:polyhydroxyalkanoate synthase
MPNHEKNNLLENIQQIWGYYQNIIAYLCEHQELLSANNYNIEQLQELASQIWSQFVTHPERFYQPNMEYFMQCQELLTNTMQKFCNKDAKLEAAKNIGYDKRFSQEIWRQNLYFDFIKNYYLLTTKWVQDNTNACDLDQLHKNYLQFLSTQLLDAMAPSNFIFSNPQVLQESIDTGFANIANGMKNFWQDLQKSNGVFSISTTKKSYFKLGKDLAKTPGKVIFKNEIMELICYEPKDKTHCVPLLILPPWINKYYILDLSENNSLVKWLADNNFQVFLISWRNPKKKHANLGFENYLQDGALKAIEVIQSLGFEKVNALGYCLGGTLLSIMLGYLKAHKKDAINNASFLTTLIDFSQPGNIGVFVNKNTYGAIAEQVNRCGYLDGRYLSNSFSLIRANDLIWSFFVNNYLLGKAPVAFDILYWNSDSTNLPAKMYLDYLKNMYIENQLVRKNAFKILGTEIDLSSVDVPSFSLAAKADHIALWTGVYNGYLRLGGPKTFCLTEAGHVAGVVNPPQSTKYSYFINDKLESNPHKWLEGAKGKKESWWHFWIKWLADNSGHKSCALDYEHLEQICPAPGNYVKNLNQ